jgi:hypothetical protein
MAKPIAVLYIPRNGYFSFHGSNFNEPAIELMRMFNGNFGEDPLEHAVNYPQYWTDYYWLVFPADDIT